MECQAVEDRVMERHMKMERLSKCSDLAVQLAHNRVCICMY